MAANFDSFASYIAKYEQLSWRCNHAIWSLAIFWGIFMWAHLPGFNFPTFSEPL